MPPSHPHDSASTSKCATSAYRGPITSHPLAPLLLFASCLPAGCRIACCRVPPTSITFCCTAAARVHPQPLLFVRASWLNGCRIAFTSLHTASASQRATTSRLAVSLPLPMRRRSCRQCCRPSRCGNYWLRIAPAAARATANKKKVQNVFTLLTILMAIAVRQYHTMRITRWRRFVTFIKATKRHHRASTCSDIIKGTCLPLFQGYISSSNC